MAMSQEALQDDERRPYAATANVAAVLQRVRRRNLPETIDDEFYRVVDVPDVVFGRVRQALRFLDMVGEDDRPTDRLRSLARSSDEEFQDHLAAAVREAYRNDFERIDPAQDTQAQIVSAFRRYQPRSQTSRMVMLFLGLCRTAGIPVLDAPRERSMRGASTTKSLRKEKPKPKPKPTDPGAPATSQFPLELTGLLNSLPDRSAGWTKDRRDKFLEAFGVVLDFVIPVKELHEFEEDSTSDRDEE